MIRFLVIPGEVRSRSDGQRHLIRWHELTHLYRVDPEECVVLPDYPHETKGYSPEFLRRLIVLEPQESGDYTQFWNLPRSLSA